jgi:hypothetical protein
MLRRFTSPRVDDRGEIQAHLADVYGADVSRELISR